MRNRIRITVVLLALIVLVCVIKTTTLFLPRVTYHDSFKENSEEHNKVAFYQFEVIELITKEKELEWVRYSLEGNINGEYFDPYISVTILLDNKETNLSKYTQHIYQTLGKKYPISFNQVAFENPALIKGNIKSIDTVKKRILVASVEDGLYDTHPYSCYVSITDDSIIRDLYFTVFSFEDFKIGDHVEVFTDSGTNDTDPLQALGDLVIINK